MPNIRNHAETVGPLTLEERPFDALDALVLSQFAYVPLDCLPAKETRWTLAEAGEYLQGALAEEPLDFFTRKRCEIFFEMAQLPRFAAWEVCNSESVLDKEREMQFSATTFVLGGGMRCIAFRGTDMTLVGWKEDFNMSFTTVPSQHEAAEYVQKAAQGHGDVLCLCGHSKGGNLAVYSAAVTDASARERIRRVYSFDAPGVDEGTLGSEGYSLVHERIESYLPQSSVVGMLLNYHPVYTVVRANTLGVLQHDPLSWQIREGAFVTLPGVDRLSSITDETVHRWLAGFDLEERRFLVDTLYRVVASAQTDLVTEMVSEWKESAERMAEAVRGLTLQEKKGIRRMLRSLFATGANEVLSTILQTLVRRE